MRLKKRAILNDVLSRIPDKPLYHYTTQAGLLGIINAREIWATHTQYLNDRREFLHAVDLVRNEIQRLAQETPNHSDQPAREQMLQRMQEALSRSPENMNVCVCSFSEDSDSLSQWRAYGRSSGFAVGFSGEVLKASTQRLEWYLAPCIYDPSEQRALVRALVENVLEENLSGETLDDSNPEDENIFRQMGGNLVADLNCYAPMLKDQSCPIFCKRLDYREGKSLIVPYYKLPLCEDNQRLHLHEIVVGPTRDAERSKSSVTSLIVSRKVVMQGIGGVNIRISQVPYRDW
ncbi:MAG: hypothetical protein DMF60_14150 [Acidobacteria bacterium]|nr:MAG: hypothetical protein DMF60_14150 [Acidobacteriota bacterium]